ncbi:hypothetical protein ES703_114963 [subsurface metagenome]
MLFKKKCPSCGAEGRWHGEHETAVRHLKLSRQTIVDVGWRCWNCDHEWGFELLKDRLKVSEKGEGCD